MTDSVTILTCAPGKRAHKIFRADGTVDDFDAGGLFKFTTVPIASLLELCAVIETVRTRTDAFLIYGEPVRHFAVAQPRKWVGDNPTLRAAQGRRWLCLDFDTRTESTIEELRDALPPSLRGAMVAWVPSARYAPGVLRGKLFVWFDRPITLEEAETIAKTVGADPSVTRAGQPIYVADPHFEAPLVDPCPDRNIVILDGGEASVPEAVPDLDSPKLLQTQSPNRATVDTRVACAIDWCQRAPAAVSGAGGHNDLFDLFATLIVGYGLDVDTASELAAEHYNPRCVPPFDVGSQEWAHKVESGAQAQREPDYLVDAYEAETFTQAGLVATSAGDGSAWFEDAKFAELLELLRTDELQFERVINELEKLLPKGQAKKLSKLVRKAARELAKKKPADRAQREIIAFDGRAWVTDGEGGYTAPVKKSNLLVRLENLGRSDLICGDEKTTWRFNVSLATECIRDFGTRVVARWEDPETIVTGCPLPSITPREDALVDAWLRELFGPGYAAACQWIAVCCPEHAQRLSAALVIIGPTSAGKTFFAHCMAKLWGATKAVKLGIAVSRFNGACERTPVWLDDECVELQRGEFTSEQFIELIQNREHDVERKGVEHTSLRGACRLVLTCNDVEQLAFGSTLGSEALRALAGRLSAHDCTQRNAQSALAKLRRSGANDADVERILGHLRWIQLNTLVEDGSERFVGAYSSNGAELTRGTIERQCPEAFEAIREVLSIPGDSPAFWCLREGGRVLVYPVMLADVIGVSLARVQGALRAVSRKHERKEQHKVNGKNVAFWMLTEDAARDLES